MGAEKASYSCAVQSATAASYGGRVGSGRTPPSCHGRRTGRLFSFWRTCLALLVLAALAISLQAPLGECAEHRHRKRPPPRLLRRRSRPPPIRMAPSPRAIGVPPPRKPASSPQPAALPSPKPAPSPAPAPAPPPGAGPAHSPRPSPAPAPAPPAPTLSPAPAPLPAPASAPAPLPVAKPAPLPSPAPAPGPTPAPGPLGGALPPPAKAPTPQGPPTFSAYQTRTDGDELLVLTVQRDPRASPPPPPSSASPPGAVSDGSPPSQEQGDGGAGEGGILEGGLLVAGEQRLFFNVRLEGPGTPGVDASPPAVIRRVVFSESVDLEGVLALETGDLVFHRGNVREPAAAAAAAGRRHRQLQQANADVGDAALDLVDGPDGDWDSDFFNATFASRRTHSFYNDKTRIPDLMSPGYNNVSTLTLILNVCGVANTITPEILESYYFGDPADGGPTLKQFFDGCSHGSYPFNRPKNRIVGPIDVPCSAVPGSGRAFDSERCTDREVFGWAQYGLDWVQQNVPSIPVGRTAPLRRVFLLPDLPACAKWRSLASVGCSSNCPVFLKVASDATPRSVVSHLIHDLGHTYSFSHAAAVPSTVTPYLPAAGGPRADGSCPMGAAAEVAGLVCPNAANAWKVGWVTLVDENSQVNGTQDFRSFLLPAASASANSVVQIKLTPEWIGDSTAPVTYYYVSYRLSPYVGAPPPAEGEEGPAVQVDPGLYDAGLKTEFDGKVYVHRYDGDTARFGTRHKPVLVGSSGNMGVDNVISLPEETVRFFKVKLAYTDSSGATVQVCTSPVGGMPQFEAVEGGDCEMCVDGLDNDCNGAADFEDAACIFHGCV